MRLSRTIVYAIHAILQLAEVPSEAPVSRSHLAAAGGLPERFLLEVLRSLCTAGLVRSIRGVEGGFSLARPPDQITLRDIFQAFDYPRFPYVPVIEGQHASIHDQLLGAMEHASNAALGELQKVTVAELRHSSRAVGANSDTDGSAPHIALPNG